MFEKLGIIRHCPYGFIPETQRKNYQCGWCKFKATFSATVLRHHYRKHPILELDIVVVKHPDKSPSSQGSGNVNHAQRKTDPHAIGKTVYITKTRLYTFNFDPVKAHFYIVKLGFTGVYIIFLISVQIHGLQYSLEPPYRGGSNEYPQSMFGAEI